MQVVVTGASGLVGTALVKALRARATPVTAVSRRPAGQEQIPGVTWIGWDGLTDAVAGAAGVVHLAGAGIVDQALEQRAQDAAAQQPRRAHPSGGRGDH